MRQNPQAVDRRGGKGGVWLVLAWSGLASAGLVGAGVAGAGAEVRLVTVDPGHFHAALFHKDRLPGVAQTVQVYAPLGLDLLAHLGRMAQFNLRTNDPTDWKLEVYAGADWWQRLLAESPATVAVISGRNRGKLQRIQALVGQGKHVLADKPWIIEPEDFPKLKPTLEAAAHKGVAVYDAMTQRYEVARALARELLRDPGVFGAPLAGSDREPAVLMRSLHYLLKEVAGAPNLRPAWFFDVREQGEALADVGTHLADLVTWTLFPDTAIDWQRDIQVRHAAHWPTRLTRSEFRRVTGLDDFPATLAPAVKQDQLQYLANHSVNYTLRGVHVRLELRWDFAPRAGEQDAELAVWCGTRARVEVRQERRERFRAELYVAPASTVLRPEVVAAVKRRLQALGPAYPGLTFDERGDRLRVVIPDSLRTSHEEHFALLVRQFLGYVASPESLPAWEGANLLAKYYVTTEGVRLARRAAPADGNPN